MVETIMELGIELFKSVIFDPNCIPFSIAFILLMVALVFEVIGLVLMGTGILSLLDHLIPDATPDHHFGAFFDILHWVKHKNVPVSIWMSIVLSVFAVIGFTIQTIAYVKLGYAVNMFVVSLIAITPAIFIAKLVSDVFGSFMFVDSTVAITVEDLVGCEASIVIGVSTQQNPAECKIVDRHGKPHYMMAVPFNASGVLTKSDSLVVLEVNGNMVYLDKKIEKEYTFKFNF